MASIGEASRRSGVHCETIRYYERVGLAPPPPRLGNGRRYYGEAAIRRLCFIRRAREFGFSLKDIRALLALSERTPACDEARSLALRHREIVRAKIRELKRIDRFLSQTSELCSTSAAVCPIIETLASGAS